MTVCGLICCGDWYLLQLVSSFALRDIPCSGKVGGGMGSLICRIEKSLWMDRDDLKHSFFELSVSWNRGWCKLR